MSGSWVSPKLRVGPSFIAGVGTFAQDFIKKDEVVIVQGGRILPNAAILADALSQHCFQVAPGLSICPLEMTKLNLDGVFHVNHSCDPSCGFSGQIVLVARRDIAAGEEITYDYVMTDVGDLDVEVEPIHCACGSSLCRKLVTGEDWRSSELRKRYRGYLSHFVAQRSGETTLPKPESSL